MKKLSIVFVLFVIFTACMCETCFARQDDTMTTLPSITVSGKQTEKPSSETLLEKTVTTRAVCPAAGMDAGQVNDVTDLLKGGGLIFLENSSYGKKVFLRGMDDQSMRILINGMPVGQMGRYYARSFEWETIPDEAVEKIEVTGGPGSAAYGNTLAGTVNIITRKGSRKIRSGLKMSCGRFDDRKLMAVNSGTHGQIDWVAGGSYHKNNGYLENSSLEDSNGFVNMGIDLGDSGRIIFSGYGYHKNEGYVLDDRVAWNIWSESRDYAPGSSFTLDNAGTQIVYQSGLFDLAVSYTDQKRDSDPEKITWSAGDVSDYTSDFTTPAAKLVFHHSFGSHTMSLGGEYARGKAESDWEYYNQGTQHVDFSQNLGGFFFEDSWDIFSKVNMKAGIRYDSFKNTIKNFDPQFESSTSAHQWSPRYTLSFKPDDDCLLYFSGGRIFKAPTMADQYRWYSNYNFISFAGRAVLRAYYGINQPPGAPASIIPDQYKQAWRSLIGELKPVKGWDYELGIRKVSDRFAYHVNLFYQDIEDYIELFPVSYPPTYNVDNVHVSGLEVSGKYLLSPVFEIECSYTWEHTKKHGDKLIEKLYNETKLANSPTHLFNLTFRAGPFRGFTAEWQTRYIGKRFAGGAPAVPPQVTDTKPEYEPMTYLGGYTTHNLRLGYALDMIHGVSTKFLLAIENITNVKNWERLDYPNPGTVVYGGVQFEF